MANTYQRLFSRPKMTYISGTKMFRYDYIVYRRAPWYKKLFFGAGDEAVGMTSRLVSPQQHREWNKR